MSALAVFALVALSGCAAGSTSFPTGSAPSSTPSAAATVADGVTIQWEENAQVELTAPSGRRVLIDVWNKDTLSKPATANDILLTTHGHSDHYLPEYVDAFPGQKLTIKSGRIALDDVTITGIPAAHNEGDEFVPEGGTNYIFLIEVGGLRIAHFGDLGQNALTADQLATLGKVDVAFSQLKNNFSVVDDVNRKGFNQMNQVKPRILVPTHFDLTTAKMGAAEWKSAYAARPVTVRASTLPAETTLLFLGQHGADFGKAVGASEATW